VFLTLDEYLAYRARLGTSDRPYYLEVSPERYDLIRGRTSQDGVRRIFTREELIGRFGFNC